MARRIRNLSPVAGAPPKYPWTKWTDGSAWRITHGEDFQIPPTSMAAIIRSHARRHGLFVITRRNGDAVEFQFVASEPAPRAVEVAA